MNVGCTNCKVLTETICGFEVKDGLLDMLSSLSVISLMSPA